MTPPPSSTSPVYRELAAALRTRLAVIADREAYSRDAAAHLRWLQTVSEEITALQARLPEPKDSVFAHYLERCSYDKALAWLEEKQAV